MEAAGVWAGEGGGRGGGDGGGEEACRWEETPPLRGCPWSPHCSHRPVDASEDVEVEEHQVSALFLNVVSFIL